MNQSLRPRLHALLGLVLAMLLPGAASAATYNIGLLGGGSGSGSFTFTNSGSSGTAASVTLSTNASSTIGVQSFTTGTLNVVVAAVDFNDEKTTTPGGANQITGNYVEGLTGSLATVPTAGAFGCNSNQDCFHRITFGFTSNANPNAAQKTYMIEVVRVQGNQVLSTPVPNGTYSVANTATIPEPGSLALMGIGLMALVWLGLRRRDSNTAAA